MRYFLVLASVFALIFFSHASFAGAQYAIVPSAGATFDSMAGIIPQAAPYTFTASAANDGVVAARSIPVAANTPYGPVSGTVKTAGILSKPAAAALGKGLMRLNLAVQIGSVLYDVYQAANMTVDSAGVPTIASSAPTGFVDCMTGFSDAGAMNANVPAYCASKPDMVFGHTPIASNLSGVCPQLVFTGWSTGFNGYSRSCLLSAGAPAPASVPATVAQKEAAIDTFANNSTTSANALRLASDAYAAKISLPNILVVGPQSQPATLTTPWQTVGTTTDANGNKLSVQKQAQIDISPSTDPLATTDSPMPVRITENTQTINNVNAPVSSATTLLTNTQPGATASPAVTPQTPADLCKDHPDASACATMGDGTLPTETIGTKSIDVSQNMGHFSFAGAGACPADKTVLLGSGATSIKVSYTPLCTFLGIFRIAAIAMGLFVSGLIVMGQRASDGAA